VSTFYTRPAFSCCYTNITSSLGQGKVHVHVPMLSPPTHENMKLHAVSSVVAVLCPGPA